MTRQSRGNRLLGAGTSGNTISGEPDAETLFSSLSAATGAGPRGGGFGTRTKGGRRSSSPSALIGGTGLSGLSGGSFNIGPIGPIGF